MSSETYSKVWPADGALWIRDRLSDPTPPDDPDYFKRQFNVGQGLVQFLALTQLDPCGLRIVVRDDHAASYPEESVEVGFREEAFLENGSFQFEGLGEFVDWRLPAGSYRVAVTQAGSDIANSENFQRNPIPDDAPTESLPEQITVEFWRLVS